MPRPRVRFDEAGQALPCKVFIPPHLARFLYREALKGRKGEEGGKQVDETEIVIRLIEKWVETLPPLDWTTVLRELKAEADAEAIEEKPKSKSKRKGS